MWGPQKKTPTLNTSSKTPTKSGWGSNPNPQALAIKYVPKDQRGAEPTNLASQHFSELYKSEQLQVEMDSDDRSALKSGTIYLPNFFCSTSDLTIFKALKTELIPCGGNSSNLVSWSQHYKFENPDSSRTFSEIVNKLSKHFNVTILQTRINYYKDGSDFKPFHHDSHAYHDTIREDFTMGVSFGVSRKLDFKHEKSGRVFSFPQNNGDVFAFDSNVNKLFLHGVPKAPTVSGDRISCICWGKRC